MPQSFEDYQRWLGWEDVSRPPNYYELFGLERSVNDPQAMSQAAERAMSRVRGQRPGDHAKAWAALLDELREAKATLLDPTRRAAYDESLPPEVMAEPLPAAPEAPSPNAAPVNPMYPPGMGGNTLEAAETSEATPAQPAATNPAQPAANPAQPTAPQPSPAEDEEPPGILPPAFNSPAAAAPTGWGVSPQTAQQPAQQPAMPIQPVPGQSAPIQPTQAVGGQPAQATSWPANNQTPGQTGYPATAMPGQVPMAVPYNGGAAPMTGAPAAAPISPVVTPPQTHAPGVAPVAPLAAGGVRSMASLADSSTTISSPQGPVPAGLDSIGDAPAFRSGGTEKKSSSLNWVIVGCGIACLLLLGAIAGVMLKDKDGGVAQGNGDDSPADVANDGQGPIDPEPTPPEPPMPDPEPEPTPPTPDPEPPMPDPDPEPRPTPDPLEPDPVPEPEPEPEMTPPSREELLELRERLESVITSLRERNLNVARSHLAASAPLARLPEHRAMLKRHEQLTEQVAAFWDAVASGYGTLTTGEEFVVGASTKVTVVQKSGNQLEISLVGQTRRYNGPEELPTGLATALAGMALADDPAGRYECIGAWYAVDPSAETGEALKFWQQAAASGAEVNELIKVLNEDYNLTGDPEPTAETAAQLGRLLAAARAALTNRDIEAAELSLAQAEQLPMLDAHRAKYERLKLLTHYVSEFWTSYREARSSLRGGSEISSGSSVVSVVEVLPDLLIIRMSGQNQRYTDQNIPAGLARAIADQWLNQESPTTRVIKGAIAAVDPDGGPERAREYWVEAEFFGADLEDLMLVLDDTYDDLSAEFTAMQ